jgi:hypothetical protein
MPIKFGVEIECYIPYDHVDFQKGTWHRGNLLTNGWYADSDSSLDHPRKMKDLPVEFTSPILEYPHDASLLMLKNISKFMADRNSYCNETCSIHVHIGMPKENLLNQVLNLTTLFAIFEPLMYTTGGIANRVTKRFCVPMRLSYEELDMIHQYPILLFHYMNKRDHYRGFNTYHMFRTNGGNESISKDTIELRYYSSTKDGFFDYNYILSVVQLVLGLAEISSKMPPEYTLNIAKESISKITMAEKLAHIIGWTGEMERSGVMDATILGKSAEMLVKNFRDVVQIDQRLSKLFRLEKPCVVSVR